jgi:protein TonB
LTLNRFFAYSIVVHTIFIIAALSIVPPAKKISGREFLARLVSPEEISLSEKTSRPAIKPLPVIPAVPKVKPRIHSRPGATPPPPVTKGISPSVSEQGKGIQSPEIKGRLGIGGNVYEPPKLSDRDKLFDRGIIGNLAKKEDKEKKEKDTAITFDTKEYRFLIYNKRLKEKIESIWIYPPDALAHGIYGDLIIQFTIKKNGKLGAVELIRTSGHRNLDDAAMRAIKEADPFWPLPDEWGMDTYTIVGHFIYAIYGYYLR